MTDLVEQLARLSDEQRLDLLRKAKAHRRHLKRQAVALIRERLLPLKSNREIARVIDDVKNDRHGGVTVELRLAIKRELENLLGSFEDIPGSESLRRLV